MPIYTAKTEIRFHCPGFLRPIFRNEKDRAETTSSATATNERQEHLPRRDRDSNRRYLFFRTISLTPRGENQVQPAAPNPEPVHSSHVEKRSTKKSESAPIRKLSYDEAVAAIAAFAKNLKQWEPDFSPGAFKRSGTLDKSEMMRTPEEESHVRLYHTYAIKSKITKATDSLHSDAFSIYSYFVNQQPVGLMLLAASRPTQITYLVTHPGSRGAGGALLEHAVNTSAASGNGGRVQLLPENADAYEPFFAMGFCREPFGPLLTLDPSNSAKWHQVDGQWRLKDHSGKPYLVFFGEQPDSSGSGEGTA